MDDPFVHDYSPPELEIAAEFLTNWLPFLTRDLCPPCSASLRRRILSLRPDSIPETSASADGSVVADDDPSPSNSASQDHSAGCFDGIVPTGWGTDPEHESPSEEPRRAPKVPMSWADMAQEDELAAEEEAARESPRSTEVEEGGETRKKVELSREQREWIRFRNVQRTKDFICLERVNGKIVNIVDGLELHTGVFSAAEQKRIVDFVYSIQEKGRNCELREHTYSEPVKWMRGKGRVTIQFGCCYNYATDKNGNLPGILKSVVADPIPDLFKVIIRRLVRWCVLPTTCIPDSCIVNIYEPGDCIPPHIDSHDFVRPFCTVSFLSECNILFGSNLKIAGAGEFVGSMAIPLPVGSVLVLNGNGADVAKHCVPAVPAKRISITFRKMDKSKWPAGFRLEEDLQDIQQLQENSGAKEMQIQDSDNQYTPDHKSNIGYKNRGRSARRKSQSILKDDQDVNDTGPIWVRSPSGSTDSRSSSLKKRFDSLRMVNETHSQAAELAERTPHKMLETGDIGDLDSRREHGRREVRFEQKRIVVSSNVRGRNALS